MSYDLSVVLLIPAQHREAINTLAEELGYGPGNLSALLVKDDGTTWYGCHTWCVQAFLDQLVDPKYACEALSALVVSAIDCCDPTSNWAQALLDNHLTIKSPG